MQRIYLLPIRTYFIAILVCFTIQSTIAQKKNLELVMGAGVTYFLGDLGGSKDVGSFGPKDLDIPSSRWLLQGGIRLPLNNYFTLRGNLAGGYLSGNDDFSKNDIRYERNLSFRAPFIELSVLCEFYFIRESMAGLYKTNSSKAGVKSSLFNMDYYAFAGIGGNWFNPQGTYKGKWYNLQPLGTEGQGLEGSGKDPYNRTAVILPFGLGMQKRINNQLALNVEFGYRFTSSDYIDDVSGSYYEQDKISEERGEIAAYFANPSDDFIDVTYNQDGSVSEYQQRGNPNNKDSYGFLTVSIAYTLKKRTPLRRF